MAVGGQNNYPSLNVIANLVRSLVNDDKAGATGTPGEGQILTNSSVTLQNLMNSAIRETYRDVRITRQPTLIKDNYVLEGMTPVNSPLGVGVANPAVQVALQFVGYFDGLEMNSDISLPGDMLFPLEMWERQSGTDHPFGLMTQASGALAPREQVSSLREWEWRTDGIWMHGATQARDVRLRYMATYADLASPNIDWANTYVPVMDSQEAIADKVVVRYTARLGGDSLQYAMEKAKESMLRLKQEFVKSQQMVDYQRPVFGSGVGR